MNNFFITLLGFTPYWDNRPTNAIHTDSTSVYTSENFFYLGTINKIHLKTDIIDGSIVNGSRQPLIYGSVLDKPAGYKIFPQLETANY